MLQINHLGNTLREGLRFKAIKNKVWGGSKEKPLNKFNTTLLL